MTDENICDHQGGSGGFSAAMSMPFDESFW